MNRDECIERLAILEIDNLRLRVDALEKSLSEARTDYLCLQLQYGELERKLEEFRK